MKDGRKRWTYPCMIFNDMGSSIDSLTHMGLLRESIIRCFNIILPINSDGITSNRSIYWQLATMNRICRRCTIYCRCKVAKMYLLTGLVTMTLPKGPKGIHQVSCHDFKLKQPLPFRHPHTWFCRRKCWALVRLRFIRGVPTLRGAITVLFCVVVVETHDVFQMIKVQLQSFGVVQAAVTFSTHVRKISLHI